MGRSKKYAVDDFPVAVKFFKGDNKEMLLLRQKHGFLADAVYGQLISRVYEHGYYYKFDDIEILCAEIRAIYGGVFAKLKKIETVITDIVNFGLFNSELYSKKVLTSKKVQQHYLKAVKRRLISINENYWLLDKVDKGCRSQVNLNANVNNINVNINNDNSEHLNLTNTSIVSKINSKISNKLINSASAREQNKQNNTQNITRNIISDDFDITQEELAELKKYLINEIYAKNPPNTKIYMENEHNKKYFNLILDALIKAARLNHNINLSDFNYSPKYFGEMVYNITFNHLDALVNILRRKNLDEVNNIDFFILGIVVKYFENLS